MKEGAFDYNPSTQRQGLNRGTRIIVWHNELKGRNVSTWSKHFNSFKHIIEAVNDDIVCDPSYGFRVKKLNDSYMNHLLLENILQWKLDPKWTKEDIKRAL